MADEPFAVVVVDKLAFLLSDHGFRVTGAEGHVVVLETPALCVQAVRDPRGEVEVRVFRRGREHEGVWSYTGMTGGAPAERLLELAGEAMRAGPTVLAADQGFYDKLAAGQKRQSAEWTAHYSGNGPRPRRSFKLP